MYKGIEKHDFSTFEKFKVAVAYKVLKNLSFNFVEQGIEYTTLSKSSEIKVKYFIQNVLNQLPIHLINEINNIDSQSQIEDLICAVAGSGKRDRQLNVKTGLGLHFTGLTKLCYNSAHILKLHRSETFWTKLANGFASPDFNKSQVLHFTEFALANIHHPLEPVLRAIESFEFT